MDPLLERCGELKQKLVEFACSDHFDRDFQEAVFDVFPDGVVDDEFVFNSALDQFVHTHVLAGGTSLIESFVDHSPELSEGDRELLLGWQDSVHGVFEIKTMAGDDGFVVFNHIDELTYRVRSNMGAAGVAGLTPGAVVVGRIVPATDFWMISGPMSRIPADETWRAAYRHTYERFGSVEGPWTEPDLDLPDWWTEADSVGIIYDELDGLGFYVDFALLAEAFDDPALLGKRRYRDIVSEYLRGEIASPVPIVRLAAADPDQATALFGRLLKKPGFSWHRDGEALLRRYKSEWYDDPPLPRIVGIDTRRG